MKPSEKTKPVLFIGPVSPPISGPGIKNRNMIDEMKKMGINIYVINTINWKKRIFVFLFKIVFNKYDRVILSVSANGRWLTTPILWVKSLLFQDFKYVVIPAGGGLYKDLTDSNILKQNLELLFLSKADVIFAQTKELTHNLKKIKRLNKIMYFPNFKKKVVIEKKDVNNKSFRIVFASRVKKTKGVELAIEAINDLIIEENIKITFDIYGPIQKGYEENFLEFINRYKFVDYKGILEPETISDVISAYNLFLFPTYWENEGFPGVLLDAYIAELPVVASDWCYNSEIVKNKENGYIFKPRDKNDLKKKILYCYNNPEILKQMSYRNKEEAKAFFSDIVVGNLVDELNYMDWNI